MRAGLESTVRHFELLSEKPYPLSGMDGFLVVSNAQSANQDLYYMQWVYVNNGIFYQLAAWGAKGSHDLASLEKHALEVFSGFRLLESERGARAVVATNLLTDIRSEEHGFSLALAGTRWSDWPGVKESVPEAAVGGLHGDVGGFVVVPLYLGELTPSHEVLASAMLSVMGIEWSDVKASQRRVTSEGYEIDFERNVDDADYVYRIHVSRNDSAGYMLASWVRRGEDTAMLDDVLSRFELAPAPPFGGDSPHQGSLLNEMGLTYYQRAQYAQSAPFFEAASRTSPTDPVLLENLVSALAGTERYGEGLKRLDECGGRFPDTVSLHSYRPFFLAKLGRYDEAADGYHELFASGYENDSDLWDYADVLWELEREQDAIDVVAVYRRDRDSVRSARLHALLLRRTDEHDRAIAILEKKQRAHPSDVGLAGALLDAQYEAEHYDDSLELARKLIAKGMASEEIHFRKGRSELALGRYEKAQASFEAALDVNPSDADAREYLDYVTGQLGQGEHDSVRRPIEAVAVPEHLLTSSAAPNERAFEDFGAYYTSRVSAISFRANEEYRRTERYVIHLTDQKVVSTFSSFEFDFNPRHERIYVNELRVLDENGKTVSTGDISAYYVTDDTSDDLATSDKILNIPVAGLEPGSTLRLTVTRQYTSPPATMPFIRHMFSLSYPTLKSSLYVSGSIDQLRHRTAHLEPASVTSDAISWTIDEPPIYRVESLSESVERYMPFVWIGDNTESWETLARDYLARIEDRLVLDDETKALALSLVEGAATSEERVAALSDYVQDNFTYKAIEFGSRGRVPNFTMEIVGNRYGDCKDHSLLFYQLLRAVDEPADLVLVSTRNEVQTAVPSVDQFNHMIVYASGHRGGHFFDLTDKNHNVASLPPMGLGGVEALLLDPAAPRFVRLPEYPEDGNRLVSHRKLEVDGSRDLVVDETLTLHGYYAAWLRSALKSSDSATQKRQIQSYMRAEANAVVQSLSAENLADPRKPLVLHVRYRLPGALYEADQTLVGKVPAIWERTFLDVTPSEERLTPFRIEYPVRVESEVTVTVPEGYRVTSAPKDVQTMSARVEWEVSTTQSGPSLVLRSRSWRPSGRGSAEEFPELVSTMSSFLASLERAHAGRRCLSRGLDAPLGI